MSETVTPPSPAKTSTTPKPAGVESAAKSTVDVAPKTDSTSTAEPSSATESTSSTDNTSSAGDSTPKSAGAVSSSIQNGKGDAPRNISPRFRSNFDKINWSR